MVLVIFSTKVILLFNFKDFFTVYFILIGCLLLLLAHLSFLIGEDGQIMLYNTVLMTSRSLAVALEVTAWVVLLLPLAFMLGLFSQIKTFLNWFLEEIEFHVFGGSGSSGLRTRSTIRPDSNFNVNFKIVLLD